jgi:hypothetical protein
VANIILTATRLNVQGRCKFVIEANEDSRITEDPVKAAKILSHLGVTMPSELIDHAREWGFVEISQKSRGD